MFGNWTQQPTGADHPAVLPKLKQGIVSATEADLHLATKVLDKPINPDRKIEKNGILGLSIFLGFLSI